MTTTSSPDAIIDGLVYLGRSHYGWSHTADELIAGLNRVHIGSAIAVAAHPTGADFQAANDQLLAAAGGHRQLIPVARIDPWAERPGELSRVVRAGAKGVFLHPAEEHFRINDQVRVRPIMEAAAEHDVPVMIAAGFHLMAEPLQLGEAAGWVPELPVVLTNGGQFNISGGSQFDVELIMEQNPNLHVHTTAMYRQDFLERVVTRRGPDRLLFASAAPLFTMEFERARADLMHVDATQRALIMGGNAARIFRLGAAA
ncbi:hypothetical protein GCM10011575_14340 [Microlunatus endophyticus]|uniref:Amidohydrolase-related domain-containing protein n=1 Tax=Microlunatus endophyticus TaxID=1716077 RepID=A0A917W1B8_9ACTN|nr:amidohydrolase family protein [Microlunatus endophyticus]GGL57057.1 hypothetical protein GCM10011575_14340 [Microlunatus endophyticus]